MGRARGGARALWSEAESHGKERSGIRHISTVLQSSLLAPDRPIPEADETHRYTLAQFTVLGHRPRSTLEPAVRAHFRRVEISARSRCASSRHSNSVAPADCCRLTGRAGGQRRRTPLPSQVPNRSGSGWLSPGWSRHPDELADKTFERPNGSRNPYDQRTRPDRVGHTGIDFGDMPAHVAERSLHARNRFVIEITKAIVRGRQYPTSIEGDAHEISRHRHACHTHRNGVSARRSRLAYRAAPGHADASLRLHQRSGGPNRTANSLTIACRIGLTEPVLAA